MPPRPAKKACIRCCACSLLPASAAHRRVAEPSAFYALPEGQHGLFVGGGGSVRLPRLIGASRMVDMMLTGRTYGAADGLAIGLSQ